MGNKKTAVSMAVISGAGLVLMGLSTPTVSAATNAPANAIHSKNTITVDGKTYDIDAWQSTGGNETTGNETYNPAPVKQDMRPASDWSDMDDNGNPITPKVEQDQNASNERAATDEANAKAAQQKATDEANAKATADQATDSAQQQAKDDLAAQQELQQKQAQAEKLVAQQAATDKAAAEAKQQADIDEADAKAATQQELQQKQAQAQELLMQQAAAQKIQDAQAKVDAKDPKKIYDKLQKQYQNEFDTTQKENQKLPQVGEKGLIVYPERVNKSNGVSAFGKTDRIRGIAAVLNQYYPVINIGDMESPEDIEYGGGAVGTETGPVSYGYYSRNGSDIFKFELYSGKILYSNLSKSTAGPELIAKYAGFKPLISDDIVAAMIDNEGVISYIHNTGVLDKTIDPNVKFDSTGHVLAPVYPVDVANAIANSNEVNNSGSIAPAKPINSVTPIAPAKPTAPSTEATPKESVPLKTRAEVQADIAAQKSAAKSAAKAAKKATRKVATVTVVPATFAVNNLTQATNSNHVNVSSTVNTTISQSSVANTDKRDNLPKTGVSNDSKTNNIGIFASLLALISAAVLGLKKKFN